MEVMPLFVVMYCVFAYALFWIVRLGVRYGMDDALRKNSSWLAGSRQGHDSSPVVPDDGA